MSDRVLAKMTDFDVEIEDRGWLVMTGSFRMDGSGIGLGYIIDTDFIKAFLRAVGASSLRDVSGKSCWITLKSRSGPVVKIEPLHKDDGGAFDIEAWQEKLKANHRSDR